MPSRRAVLAIASSCVATGLAGCNGNSVDQPPAGSLRVVNQDTLPHELRMGVIDTGTAAGEEAGTVTGDPDIPGDVSLTMTVHLDAGATQTHESVFSQSVWYAVEFAVDGRVPDTRRGRVAFNPAPSGADRGRTLEASVSDRGSFGWSIAATDNPGTFEF